MSESRVRIAAALIAMVGLSTAGTAAVVATVGTDDTTSAEIHIGLTVGKSREVTVSPAGDRWALELPEGATYPQDLVAASGGFLRDARATRLDDGRVRLSLELAQGVLEQIVYRPEGLLLRFSTRFSLSAARVVEGYRLGPDDEIKITVHNFPDLTTTVTLGRSGTITLPLIGEVTAAGLTVDQLAAMLADRWAAYIVTPQIDVQVEDYRSQWVMVAGEVRSPGRVALRGGATLKDVLTDAEGFAANAGETIKISRRANGVTGPLEIVVDREKFERGVDNPALEHGDIITVERTAFCYIQGEVRQPGKIPLERGMTLLRAISVAGGLGDWANAKAVRVRREGESGPGQIYNLRKIWKGVAEDPVLTGGEVIHVGRRAL